MIKIANNLSSLLKLSNNWTPWELIKTSNQDAFAAQAMGVRDPSFIDPANVKARMAAREKANPDIAALRAPKPSSRLEDHYKSTPTLMETIMTGGLKSHRPKLMGRGTFSPLTGAQIGQNLGGAGGLTGAAVKYIKNKYPNLNNKNSP